MSLMTPPRWRATQAPRTYLDYSHEAKTMTPKAKFNCVVQPNDTNRLFQWTLRKLSRLCLSIILRTLQLFIILNIRALFGYLSWILVRPSFEASTEAFGFLLSRQYWDDNKFYWNFVEIKESFQLLNLSRLVAELTHMNTIFQRNRYFNIFW